MTPLNRTVLGSATRLVFPIAVYPGAQLAGVTVKQMATDVDAQTAGISALLKQLQQPFAQTGMDLSVEAEAFGCSIKFPETEVPSVHGRLVSDEAGAEALAVPEVGACRTQVALDTAKRLLSASDATMVFGGVIGPFSLAARLFGVSEMLELTLDEPEVATQLLEKATAFVLAYTKAFKEEGVQGVIMAEPAAGLLSPRGMASFSSAYVRQIVEEVDDASFGVVYHNCGAKVVHLPQVLATTAKTLHFGQPMDLQAALPQVPKEVVVMGNLDPSAVLVAKSADEVRTIARTLSQRLADYPNFVLSSGCDIPASVPPHNLQAFVNAMSTSE